MPRKRTQHRRIVSDRLRKLTLKQRTDSLIKKAKELSILCGIPVAVIIQDPNKGSSVLWPSPEETTQELMKFLSFPEHERLKKMVLHEKLLMDAIKSESEEIEKLRKSVEQKETMILMSQITDGSKIMSELSVREFEMVKRFSQGKIDELQKRREALQKMESGGGSGGQSGGPVPETQSAAATLMEEMREDQWFIENVSGVQINIINPSDGTHQEPSGSGVAGPSIEENLGGFADAFDQEWQWKW